MHDRSVFVIGGGGMVGATAAQALAITEVAHDIVLLDVAADLVRGQALDINHATAFTNGVHVRAGSYEEIKDNDIIVIASGAPQKPGQSRLELAATNVVIVRDVVRQIMAHVSSVFLLMVANPVDVLTYVALQESGLPKEQVLGSGTTLDTARLRVTLANELKVSQRHVHGYILGEHGNSSFAALSHLTIGGIPFKQYPGYTPELASGITEDIRQAAYQIIEAKRSTYYGIGNTVVQIVEALLHETASILTVSSLAEAEYGLRDVCVGLPSLVSKRGVKILDNYPLDAKEERLLADSAAVVAKATIEAMAFAHA